MIRTPLRSFEKLMASRTQLCFLLCLALWALCLHIYISPNIVTSASGQQPGTHSFVSSLLCAHSDREEPTMQQQSSLSSIDEYINKAGPAPLDPLTFCAQYYSPDMIRRWRAAAQDYCTAADAPYGLRGVAPPPSTTTSLGTRPRAKDGRPATRMACHYKKEGPLIENVCDVANLVVDLSMIPDTVVNTKKDKKYVIPVDKGALQGACRLNKTAWQPTSFGPGGQAWLHDAFDDGNDDDDEKQGGGKQRRRRQALQCDAWVEHDVYFLVRYDNRNLFHFHEDAMQAWLGMAVAGVDPSNTEVILLDPVTNSTPTSEDPFHLFWERVFTGDHVRRHIQSTTPFYPPSPTAKKPQTRDMIQVANYYRDQGVRYLCFARGIFGPYARITPFSHHLAEAVPCRPDESAVFLGFRDFILDRLGLSKQQRAPVTVDTPVRIVFSSRRGLKNADRTIRNERRLLRRTMAKMCDAWENITVTAATTSSTEPKLAPLGDVCGVTFEVVDFGGGMTLKEQIALATSTDILIGAHGAALTLSLYQPGSVNATEVVRGGVIEIQSPMRWGNYHFENLAGKVGLQYHKVETWTDLLREEEIDDISSKAVEFAVQIHRGRREAEQQGARKR